MFKKIVFIVCVGMFFFGIVGLSYSERQEKDGMTQEVEVGNKICPVSGEKIEEKLKATYEYNGKVYNFCCASCVEEFKKDPDKYIKKVNEESQSQVKEEVRQNEMMPETGMPTTGHEGMQH